MIKRFTDKIFSGEKVSESITQSAVLIAVMGIASRLLGLVRDRILASNFGAGDVLDSYYAAFKIPDLIYSLLVTGAIAAAFVPIFTSLVSKEEERKAWRLVNLMVTTGVVVIGLLSAIIFFLVPTLVQGLTFGYDEQKQTLVVMLTRVMLISPMILGLSGIFGGVLNSFKKFFFYSLAPIFYNIGIVIGAVLFSRWLGPVGLGVGVVLGAFLHLLIQLPEVFRSGFRFRPEVDFGDENLKKVVKLMVPRALGVAVSQINLIVVTVLASTLAAGSLAVFSLADNLQSVPIALFGISFAIASFPTLSSLWAKEQTEEFMQVFLGTLRKTMFFVIPASALIFALRAQIVRVVLGTGRFDWEDTLLTLEALGIFSFSLWAQGAVPILARVFYATCNTKVPFVIGLFSSLVNVLLALMLIEKNGILGLVWAYSISSMINAFLLFVTFRVKVGRFRSRHFLKMISKLVLATLLMLATVQLIKMGISDDPFGEDRTFLGVLTQLLVASLGGLVVFVLAGKWLRITELDYFFRIARKRMLPKKPLAEAGGEDIV